MEYEIIDKYNDRMNIVLGFSNDHTFTSWIKRDKHRKRLAKYATGYGVPKFDPLYLLGVKDAIDQNNLIAKFSKSGVFWFLRGVPAGMESLFIFDDKKRSADFYIKDIFGEPFRFIITDSQTNDLRFTNDEMKMLLFIFSTKYQDVESRINTRFLILTDFYNFMEYGQDQELSLFIKK